MLLRCLNETLEDRNLDFPTQFTTGNPLYVLHKIEELLPILAQAHPLLRQLDIEGDPRATMILAPSPGQHNKPGA